MKLSSIVCCENIIQEQTMQKTELINPIQVMKLLNTPSTFSFAISIGLIEIDKNGEDSVNISIFDSNMKEVYGIGPINFPLPPMEILQQGEPYAVNMNFDIRNMIFENVGMYNIAVFDSKNNIKLGEVFIEVKV